MRKLKRGDEGIAMVLTTIAMAALLACASLAIDIGQTAASTRSVQNSADAAALAAANDCARGTSIRPLTQYGNGAAATCNTSSSTATGTASKAVDRLFGTLTIPTQRSATAKWGTLSSFTDVFPLTIGTCAMNGLTPGKNVTLHSSDFGDCDNGSGQFGWLNISCSSPTKVDTSGGLDGTTGNTPKSCTDAQLDAFMGTDVMVPVFDPDKTCGSHDYCISYFAQFHLTGWSGNGASSYGCGDDPKKHACPPSVPPSTLGKQCNDSLDGVSPPSSDTKPCIRGYFIKPIRVEDLGQVNPGACNDTELYVCRVYLSS
jgi:Putative Flp pilus-assembly TadE/G-like